MAEPEEPKTPLPPLDYKQARAFILTPLPKGFYFYQQKNRERDGLCPCVFQYKDGDPPPPLPKSRAVIPLSTEEFRDLKLLFENRFVVSPLERSLALELEDLLENRLEEQWKDFSKELEETRKELLGEIKRIQVSSPSAPSSAPSFPPASMGGSSGAQAGVEKPIDFSEYTSEQEIAFRGVKRTMPVNPLMAMYYVFTISGGLGGFRRDPREYSIEQFITDILIEYFSLHDVRLTIERRGG